MNEVVLLHKRRKEEVHIMIICQIIVECRFEELKMVVITEAST